MGLAALEHPVNFTPALSRIVGNEHTGKTTGHAGIRPIEYGIRNIVPLVKQIQ